METEQRYILALDAGTTSIRAMLYDLQTKKFIATSQQEVDITFPQPSWVEQDANEIFFKTAYVISSCLAKAPYAQIAGLGLTNQRETVVFWDRETGEPVCPAINWQCRRTSEFCEGISAEMKEKIGEITGLQVDAYFSASKIKWGMDNVPAVRKLLNEGKLCVGTVDSYLIFRLTKGKSFVTDYTNASRTMLFNIHTLEWEQELLDFFSIPRGILPEVRSCADVMGYFTHAGREVPIAGVAGDQQAALFGQACLNRGEGKITYGTGLFMLFHTGEKCVQSKSGLISTVAYSVGDKVYYALEGSMFNAGSAVQWLRDELGLIKTSAESEQVALSVADTGGVYFVPAFTGLGAPYWRGDARALLCGVTRGTSRAHIVRAVLESIAYGARELADCMQKDSSIKLKSIKCDGGASANGFLMKMQADLLGVHVDRPLILESTALGAALLCAVSLGIIQEKDVPSYRVSNQISMPTKFREPVEEGYRNYKRAVERALFQN